jgi:BirA family biotin operon repressor/biotin-[acetyl-CoA-carboxylase] ligase
MALVADHGFEIRRFDQVSSTMSVAAEIAAAEPAADRVWVVAAQQTGGRGRMGRVWVSPPGNLHATLILRTPCALRDLPLLGFAAGVALARCIRSFLHEPARAALKWPNDLLLDGAKLAGILMENSGSGDVLVGIGINVKDAPQNLAYSTASLHDAGVVANLDVILDRLSTEMAVSLARFDRGKGFPAIREDWLSLALPIGSPLGIGTHSMTGEVRGTGVFAGLDSQGRLLLARDGRIEQHSAADVVALPSAMSAFL